MSMSFANLGIANQAKVIQQIWRHFADRFNVLPFPAILTTFVLAATSYFFAIATRLEPPPFPNLGPFLLSLIPLDLYCRYATQNLVTRAAPRIFYAIFFIALTCLIGIYASYSTQRLALPLQDNLYAAMDRALGVDLVSFLKWVDERPLLAYIFGSVYATMGMQIMTPIILLGALERDAELRNYITAFPLALAITIVVAALIPSTGAVWLSEHAHFNLLRFTGGTPVEHLRKLRMAGPYVIGENGIGGLLAFPSFHVASAMTATLSLRSIKPLFYGLLFLNIGLIVGTVTEGGHYAVDSIGGIATALAACWLAKKILTRDAATTKASV